VDANSPIKNLALPPLFFSHPAQTPLPLPSSLFFSFSSSSPSFSLSLTLSSVDQSVSQSLSLRQNHLRPSLSPSGNTLTGISSASPLISSPQVCDLLFCYHALSISSLWKLSQTLTKLSFSPSKREFWKPLLVLLHLIRQACLCILFFSILALKFVNFLMQL
jgi:hypothetical protein